jgi:hypothetical protein
VHGTKSWFGWAFHSCLDPCNQWRDLIVRSRRDPKSNYRVCFHQNTTKWTNHPDIVSWGIMNINYCHWL